jgi:hypothetical protein
VSQRYDILTRVHALSIRIELGAAGKTQSIGANISHLKPSSIEPDRAGLEERYAVEGPLSRWLANAEKRHDLPAAGATLERFHAAIVAANGREIGAILDALAQTETRLRVKWNGNGYDATPSETADDLRARQERTYLFRHFGKSTARAAKDEGVSEGTMDYIRRKHGIRKANGERKERCPESVVQLSFHDHCAICQIVDDLMAENGKAA